MTKRRAAVAMMAAAALAVSLSSCTSAPVLVPDSRIAVGTTDAVAPGLGAVAELTDTGFGLDAAFGTAEVVAHDPLTVRYTVSGDPKWSDGEPIDAVDLLLDWAARSGATGADPGFEAPPDPVLAHATTTPQLSDDHRAIFLHFDTAQVAWRGALRADQAAHVVATRALGSATARKALAAAVLEGDTATLARIATAWNRHDASVTSGPYRVAEVDEAHVTLVANPQYRGERMPRIETLDVRQVADPADLPALMASGEIDLAVAEWTPALADAGYGGEIHTAVDPGTELEQLQLMVADGRDPALADPRVRQAFLLTVPRQAIVDELLGSALPDAVPLESSLVAPGAAEYDDVVAQNGSADRKAPDAVRAAVLLAQAGVTSPEVCLLYDPADATRVREFQLIQAAGSAAGFRVTDCSAADWRGRLGRAGAYDGVLLWWDLTRFGEQGPASVLRSDSTSLNFNRFGSEGTDALLDKFAFAKTEKARTAALADLDAAIWTAGAGVPLFAHPHAVIAASTVGGIDTASPGSLAGAWAWTPGPSASPSAR